MDERYPPIEPYDHGMLDVGDGNRVYWEVSGNPAGRPALFVHGGPGSGSGPWARRSFDPARYRVVLFDQRNCGRSTPHASDPATDLRHNTTAHLIADMERLREHLGVDSWLLYGVSWGSTLLLAYAQRHPARVSGIVIAAVTTTRRSEIDWLYRGVGRYFPREWERFLSGGGVGPDDDVVGAYARLVEDPDPAVRERAVLDWCAWEDAAVSAEGVGTPYGDRPSADRTAMVRICARYFSHGAWLAEGELIRHAGRLAGIPGVLIHGRVDLGSPPVTAWELHRAWPGSQLHLVEEAGHFGTAATRRHVLAALDHFAAAG
ncbi:prolyl aminopeptidase [Micromonospora sp. NBC_00421]|uniref:prolyl aminopeptidase n=1 Tax=Micromonospora sp. NBC_00421 TaxID=2975976 RepID=UPI002E1D0EC4